MKPNIHPEYKDVKVTCSCGHKFVTRSTMEKDSLTLEVCAMCHPFYTGTQKIVDTAGRVDRFRQKYGIKGKEEKKADDKQQQ
jgi:large subunit ribosomal protein L31